MIHMPRRSVTRFFIPLIDVLLLLFGVFLLMPMVAEEATLAEQERDKATNERLLETFKGLEARLKELSQLDKTGANLAALKRLQDEVNRLSRLLNNVQERTNVKILDIDPKTGELYYFDTTRPDNPIFKIPDQDTATYLIQKQRRGAGGRPLYYYFMLPRVDSGYPTDAERENYRKWFAEVPNSLKEVK